MQLVHLQACQLAQTHIYDSPCLNLVEVESFLQVLYSLLWCLRCTDDVNHLIYIVASHDEGFQYVCSVLCLLQVKLCAADSNIVTVVDEMLHALFQREKLWSAVYQRDAIH